MHRFLQWLRASLLTLLALGLGAAGWCQSDASLSKVEPMLRSMALKAMGKPVGPAMKALPPVMAAPGEARPLSAAGAKIPSPPKFVPPGILSSQTHDGRLYLDTFIVLKPGASTEALSALGVLVGSRSGDVITADVPPEQLEAVSALPEVVRVAGSHYVTPMNDAATLETGVQTVWSSQSNRGENALVGVIDSGIDWMHADLKDDSNLSRVQYIWDQTDNGGPNPPGYTYGTLWNKSQIDNSPGSVRERDDNEGSGGHGTHVTGTAAGDGSATGNGQPANRFVGVANKADICFVKTIFTEQSWADGCAWLYDRAVSLGKPMAINMSLGGIYGPHDGSTASEQYLNGLMGPAGRVLCIAAGNSGGQTIHAFSTLAQDTGDGNSLDDTPVVAFWAYPYQGLRVDTSVVELWYPAASTNVQWRLVWKIDTGNQAGPWMGASTNVQQATIASGPLQNVQLEMGAQIPYDAQLNYGYVAVQSPQGAPDLNGYAFYIQLKGPGVPVHVWHIIRDLGGLVPAQTFINSQVTPPAKLIEPNDDYTAATPGTAGKVITVGSYVTKVQWTDLDNQLRTQDGATLGAISGFSSKGPRRDGNSTVEQQKPDIAAPGEAVISTLSSSLAAVRPRTDVERDGVHQKMQGTSMACPLTTGICALMLSKNATLTNDQVKTILRSTARDQGPAGWDGTWGAGKIDAVAALNAVQGGQRTPGDANNDGVVDSRDAIRVLRHIGGQQTLTGDDLTAANINGDGGVDNADVDAILDKAVGL